METFQHNTERSSNNRRNTSLLRQEFRSSSFSLNCPTPYLLVSNQWGFSSFYYLIWRVLWALYHICWVFFIHVDTNSSLSQKGETLIYLTKWAYLLLTLNTVIQAIVVCLVTCTCKNFKDGKTPWYLKVSWGTYEAANALGVLVTIYYFVLEFRGILTITSVADHILNSVYILLDLCVTASPIRILHMIYPMLVAVTYLCFNLIYWAAGGVTRTGSPTIYQSLDWTKPQKAIIMAVSGLLGAIPIMQTLLWMLSILRTFIYRRMCPGLDQTTSV